MKFAKIGNTGEKIRRKYQRFHFHCVEFMVLVRHPQPDKYLLNVDVQYQNRHLICLKLLKAVSRWVSQKYIYLIVYINHCKKILLSELGLFYFKY